MLWKSIRTSNKGIIDYNQFEFGLVLYKHKGLSESDKYIHVVEVNGGCEWISGLRT